MKKFLLISFAVIVLGIMGYFLFVPREVFVSVSGVEQSDIETIKGEFADRTGGKLLVQCQSHESSMSTCRGGYTASNLFQLINYQNSLFNLAQEKQLIFIAGGSFIATLTD